MGCDISFVGSFEPILEGGFLDCRSSSPGHVYCCCCSFKKSSCQCSTRCRRSCHGKVVAVESWIVGKVGLEGLLSFCRMDAFLRGKESFGGIGESKDLAEGEHKDEFKEQVMELV